MTASSGLKFFSTPPHQCSYLDDKTATTLFADPEAPMSVSLYHQLSHYGFRRSGNHIYKPQCFGCQACLSVRIPVARFRESRQQRRVWKNNQDIAVRIVPATYMQEHYELYAKYIKHRHADGDMYPPSVAQYVSFLFADWSDTWLYEFRQNDKLLAVAVCDVLKNGLSAVYTFFDCDAEARSIGTYAVLWQINEAKRLEMDYLYLGYWVEKSKKMTYKTHFQPLEALIDQRWLPLIHDE